MMDTAQTIQTAVIVTSVIWIIVFGIIMALCKIEFQYRADVAYDKGNEDGYEVGHDDGYQLGYEQCMADNGIKE